MMVDREPPSFVTYRWTYDVFISFHGEDTRSGFTRHLYQSLYRSGIRVFIDDEGIRSGENITPAVFRAIQESRMAIIVFSENYANSTFCLEELVKILQRFKEEGRLIYPVFYYVNPSELQRPRGSYAKALARLEERFKDKDNRLKVDKWRLALSQVAYLKGYHLKSKIAKEQECITRIITKVASKINRAPLHVTNYPVGLVSRVKEVISCLDLWSNKKVKMIGIWGAGGIGKSTIARAVYNSIADNFEGLCFLSDVRRQSKMPNGLSRLQETLLCKLVMEKDLKLVDHYEGIPIIKSRLRQKKILLILDDVGESDQLEALAGSCGWFGCGSRIIITTRNKQLLIGHDVTSIYDVKELDEKESLKMLSWHAFESKNMDSNYMEASPREGKSSSKSTDVFGKLVSVDLHLLQELRSYPMRIGHADFLKQPINFVYRPSLRNIRYEKREPILQMRQLPPPQFTNLKELSLEGCKRLETLPQEIWELPNLEALSLAGTSIFQTSENQELFYSEYLPLSSSIYHEHSSRSKKEETCEMSVEGVPSKEDLTKQGTVSSSKWKYRHEFYQYTDEMIVIIFAKGVSRDCIIVDFGEQMLSVSINVPGEDAYYFQPRLFEKIIRSKCQYNVLPTKIVVRLAKAEPITWASLEYKKDITVVPSGNGGQGPTYPSSKPTRRVVWDKPGAQVQKEFSPQWRVPVAPKMSESAEQHAVPTTGEIHLGQDVLRLMRIRDFLHLILSYPMRIGYEHFLKQWIYDASQLSFADDDPDFDSLRKRVEDLISGSPLRYVQVLIPQDLTKGVENGGGVSTETPFEYVPKPILLLATHLALHQLTLTLTSDDKIQNIWFSTRDDAEKQAVGEKIKANSLIRAAFDNLQIIDLNQTDDETKRELLNLATMLEQTTSAGSPTKNYPKGRHLVLVVDGDGDKKLGPHKVILPIIRDSEHVLVFITTLSSVRQNYELSKKMGLTIKTGDHLLPWEVFCEIVDNELLHSSSAIQEIAVPIVEKCGGHLLAIILMAKSLKHVTDVLIWETALKNLRYRDREAIVNAFFHIICANVNSETKKGCLLRCLMILKVLDWKITSDEALFDRWFSEQLVDPKEEAKSILQNFMECSVLLQFEGNLGWHNIQLPEDIKIILHVLGEEIPQNLSEGALASTISDLQVLNLSNTHMRNLYAVTTQPHLKELNLAGCMLETLPEAIFKLQKVETLSLEHCSQLLELPLHIAKLENLKELRLEGCERLETLPQEIWQLPNLHTISLPGTSIFPKSENQELINSNYLPFPSSIYHEHSGHGKKAIPSSSSAIIPIGFTLKLIAHRRFTQFEKFCQYIMRLQIQNLEKCDLSGTHIADLPLSLNFPKLRNLLLGNNLNLMKIPSSFFDHVPLLSILDLSRSSIHELPNSIFNLQELREFYLKDCELFVGLPLEISRLKNLTTLDLDGTLITHLPEEIQELKKLESLSLSFCNDIDHDDSRFDVIPNGVLTQFTYLKVLRIDVNSDNEWWLKNFERVLEQISAFKKLQVLDVYIPSINFQAPIKESLSNFRFIIGHHRPRMISRVPPAIEVKFRECGCSLKFVNGNEDFPDKVKTILSEARAFFLDRHMTVKSLTNFGLENLKRLRFCISAECNEMQSIVEVDEKSIVEVDEKSFEMQFLTIFYMKNLRSIINRPILGSPVFAKLKLLALHTCPELSTIFTMDFLHSLNNLEELIVEDCPKVQSIISCPSSERTAEFFLPSLRKLSLLFVPELESISNGVRIARNLEQMGLYYCPKLQSLSRAELSSESLRKIRAETEWWRNLQWSEEWGQEGRPHKFRDIFDAFDEDLDILTQLTAYEVMTSVNTENDSE